MAYNYNTDKGIIVADTGDLLAQVQNEAKLAFGQDLNVSANTPQGAIISAETIIRSDVQNLNAAIANQINPNFASGIYLDALFGLTGLQRRLGTKGILQNVQMTGRAGTIVPAGSRASIGIGGQEFELLKNTLIEDTGIGIGDFQATNIGEITCNVGQLNTVVSNVLGWETVTNLTSQVVGSDTESDEAGRWRRKMTLGLQGRAIFENIQSHLFDTEGVNYALLLENYTDEPIDTVNGKPIGKSIVPHSIYAIIDGGKDTDIALALYESKTVGAAYNGDIEVIVQPDGIAVEQTVFFDRPDYVPVWINIQIDALSAKTITNAQEAVKNAILNYAYGKQGGEVGFAIGQGISAYEIAAAVNREYPIMFVKYCEISITGDNFSPKDFQINLNQKGETDSTKIIVSFI